jgi:DNA-binding response OmpR family regulator
MFDHANQLLTRREIVEQVLRQRYDETGRGQISRLNTAIHRLREQIEGASQYSQYLLTEPGAGYRFVLRSDS